VAPCGFIINRRFGGICCLHLQGIQIDLHPKVRTVMLISVSASHGSLSSATARNLYNMMLDSIGSTCREATVSARCEQSFKFLPTPPPPSPSCANRWFDIPAAHLSLPGFSFSASSALRTAVSLTLFLARVISSTLKMEATCKYHVESMVENNVSEEGAAPIFRKQGRVKHTQAVNMNCLRASSHLLDHVYDVNLQGEGGLPPGD
jgi:hypothetical protein